jgi:hypothetical protein
MRSIAPRQSHYNLAAKIDDFIKLLRSIGIDPLFVLIIPFATALWAALTFARNNRIKAAEILLELEKEYGRHVDLLLQLEYARTYGGVYRDALTKALSRPQLYTSAESKALDEIERTMQFLYACASIRRLSVDSGAIDRLCAYHLRILIHNKRPHLRRYVYKYWPTLYFWAQRAGRPWPVRTRYWFIQIPDRLRHWWTGSFAEPDLRSPEPKADSIVKESMDPGLPDSSV